MTSFLDKLVEIAQEHSVDVTKNDDFQEVSAMIVDIPTPKIINMLEENGEMSFDIVDCDVSFVNALRRTMLSDIPVCCIRTENEAVNQCQILVNQTRLHNEILKQRLSSIPVHTSDMGLLPGKYQLVIDVSNSTDQIMLVTTEHFKLREVGSDIFMTHELSQAIFPPNHKTGDFIHFATLKPPIPFVHTHSHTRLHLVADFSVSNAKQNSMFNVVSKCSYFANVDWDKAKTQLANQQLIWKSQLLSDADFKLRSDNFMLLDAFKIHFHNSWHFSFSSIGFYTHSKLIEQTFYSLRQQFTQLLLLHHISNSHEFYDFTHANVINFAILQFNPTLFHAIIQTHPHINSISIISQSKHHTLFILAISTALYLCGGAMPPPQLPPPRK